MDFLRFRIFALLSKQLHYTSCIISSGNPDRFLGILFVGCQILIRLCTWVFDDGQSYQHVKIYEKH